MTKPGIPLRKAGAGMPSGTGKRKGKVIGVVSSK
jgi:hypothetical protein